MNISSNSGDIIFDAGDKKSSSKMILSEDHVSFQYDEGFKVYNQEDSNPIFDIDSHELEIQGRKKITSDLKWIQIIKRFSKFRSF